MEICLIRHAIAEERGPAWPDDSLRPLTAGGKAKMEQAALGLVTLFRPEVILTSPYVRAVQTAEVVARVSGAAVFEEDALVTGDDARLLRAAFGTGRERVACVGHEPLLSATLSWLLAGHEGVASLFRKGAAAKVTIDAPRAGTGMLEWMLQPAALRALARPN